MGDLLMRRLKKSVAPRTKRKTSVSKKRAATKLAADAVKKVKRPSQVRDSAGKFIKK